MDSSKVLYRVRMRKKGKSETVAEGVDLETAYRVVDRLGGKTSKHFTIDKVIHETFSVLTAREARIRLEKGEA